MQADVRLVEDIVRRIRIRGKRRKIRRDYGDAEARIKPFLYSGLPDGPWKIARAIVNLEQRESEESDVSAQDQEQPTQQTRRG